MQNGGGDDETRAETEQAPSIFERPRMEDALWQAFPNSPAAYGRDPSDGMPKPIAPAAVADAVAPPLHPDHFVCMEDASAFVLRDDRFAEVVATFEPHEVTEMPDGTYVVATWLAAARVPEESRNAIAQEILSEGSGEDIAEVPANLRIVLHAVHAGRILIHGSGRRRGTKRRRNNPRDDRSYTDSDWTEVEPLRPACAHYARQMIDFPHEPDHQLVMRLCTARRDSQGEFVDVGNMKLHACELREPGTPNCKRKLRAFDDELVERARQNQKDEAPFDIEAALKEQETDG